MHQQYHQYTSIFSELNTKNYCFLVSKIYFLPKFLPIPIWSFPGSVKFCYILMVSRPCSPGGYIILRVLVAGLEHKQKLELRLGLTDIFSGSFG